MQLPSTIRWFSQWALAKSIKENESCLKSAIWSPKIQDNTERLKQLKKLLCEDDNFWKQVGLTEAILAPLAHVILKIEGSDVDARDSYKLIEDAFQQALAISSKFDDHQVKEIVKVCLKRYVIIKFLDSQ